MATSSPAPSDPGPVVREFYRFLGSTRSDYLEYFARVPWPALVKDMGGSLGCIRNIYLHILEGYSYWFDFVPAERSQEFVDWEGRFAEWENVPALASATTDVEALIDRFLGGLKPTDYDRSLVVAGRDGLSFVRVDTMLYHMIEEELQHRGEINSIFALQGIEPPSIGYARWLASHPARSARGDATASRRRRPGRH